MITLVIRDGDNVEERRFAGNGIRIGSGRANDLVIAGARKEHAVIGGNEADGFTFYDHKAQVVRRLEHGERFTIGAVKLQLLVLPPDAFEPREPAERELLAAIAGGDDHARLVYADWLEQHGDAVHAEFLRVQQAILRASSDTPELHAQMARLRELSATLDVHWRYAVARQLVEGCVGLQAPCPKEWAKMQPTDRPDVRACDGCHKQVFYVTTIEMARSRARQGHCIVVDSALVRTPNDLNPPMMMPGAPVAR